MAFESQIEKSRVAGRRGSSSSVVVSQNYKPSTKSEEISFRVSSSFLAKFDAKIGDKVDVLYDPESNAWRLELSSDGFTITGKDGAPTGLVRYTLKDGHARLTEERADLPKRVESDEESLDFDLGCVTFRLVK